jgi:hypothetical protein
VTAHTRRTTTLVAAVSVVQAFRLWRRSERGTSFEIKKPFRHLERAQLLRVTPKFPPRPTRSRSKSNSLTFGNESAVLIDGSKRQCQVSNVRHGFEAVEQGPLANACLLSASFFLGLVCMTGQSHPMSRSSRSFVCA